MQELQTVGNHTNELSIFLGDLLAVLLLAGEGGCLVKEDKLNAYIL